MISTKDVKTRSSDYLEVSLQLNPREIELRELFTNWLPEAIIDIHMHMNLSCHVGRVPQEILEMTTSTFLYSGYKTSLALRKTLFPGKKVRQAVFAFPFEGIRLGAANQYVLKVAEKDSSFLPFCTGTAHNYDGFMADWEMNNYCGIKFYPLINRPNQRIFDVFPPSILQLASRCNVPVVMHLPKPIRCSVDEFVLVANEYPETKIVLAHMGVEKIFSKELLLAYQELSRFSNVYLDTSMVQSKDVIQSAMESVGPDRVLFATDQPLNLLRVKSVIHPSLGLRYATDYPYHWADIEEQKYYTDNGLCCNMVQAVWGMLLAVRSAIEDGFSDSVNIKELVFSNNAKKVLLI